MTRMHKRKQARGYALCAKLGNPRCGCQERHQDPCEILCHFLRRWSWDLECAEAEIQGLSWRKSLECDHAAAVAHARFERESEYWLLDAAGSG